MLRKQYFYFPSDFSEPMKEGKRYSVIPECSVRDLGGKYLLMVYPARETPYALDVNESFARMFQWAKGQETPFTEEDLARFLEEEYGLASAEALDDARSTIQLWQENHLIQE